MNLFQPFLKLLGLDTAKEKYRYGNDPQYGYLSQAKIPDKWIPTTCGYCSVGCGMYIGIKEGRAVSVRGDPEHPVNEGVLCPKGLSEHHSIHAEGRALHPLLKLKGKLKRVSWDVAFDTLVDRFVRIQRNYGPQALGFFPPVSW